MKFPQKYISVLLILILTASCEYGRQAEEELNKLDTRAKELDGLVNDGIEKVGSLDSILPETNKRLKEADSIIKDASSTLDSLNQKVEEINRLFN